MASERAGNKKTNLNRIATWYISVIGVGCAVGGLADTVNGPNWLTPVALLVILLISLLVSPGGLLRREVYEGVRAVRWPVTGLLAVYPFIYWVIIHKFQQGFWSSFLLIALFSLVITLLGWKSFRRVAEVFEIIMGGLLILGGIGVILIGVFLWREGMSLNGLAGILIGVGIVLMGGACWQEGKILNGISNVLIGLGIIVITCDLISVDWPEYGLSLRVIIFFLGGLGTILFGIYRWRRSLNPLGITFTVGGVGMILLGVFEWQHGSNLLGAVLFVLGVGVSLLTVSEWRHGSSVLGIALILGGFGALLTKAY